MYVIVLVPVVRPCTAPENDIVATDVLLLVHDTPPPVASDTNVVAPVHTVNCPRIGDGNAVIVIVFVTKQPVPKV